MKLVVFNILFILSLQNALTQSCDDLDSIYYGEGTFYGYTGGGNCSYPPPSLPVYTGAMNQVQYDSSSSCGACIKVTGERGSLVIRVEDRCPECKYGDIDLSTDAFPFIADPVLGRVPIHWQYVACPVQGPVQIIFKTGSTSLYWTAVQIRNTPYPVAKLEYKVNGEYISINREMYNYFVAEKGLGPDPYDFRITDKFGHIIEENNIPFICCDSLINGKHQFDTCVSNYIPEISPNQGSTIFNIQGVYSKNKTITIIDAWGRSIKTNYVVSENNVTTDLSYLSPGIYFLKTGSGKTMKFIKL